MDLLRYSEGVQISRMKISLCCVEFKTQPPLVHPGTLKCHGEPGILQLALNLQPVIESNSIVSSIHTFLAYPRIVTSWNVTRILRVNAPSPWTCNWWSSLMVSFPHPLHLLPHQGMVRSSWDVTRLYDTLSLHPHLTQHRMAYMYMSMCVVVVHVLSSVSHWSRLLVECVCCRRGLGIEHWTW